LTTSIYIVMGWIIIIALKPLLNNLDAAAFKLLLSGGIIYSIGGLVYTIKKPNLFSSFGYHELWHMMVLLGSICHFFMMLFYIT
ncbi:hemolysin III family protein, partial [bacterium]|nr:hemolysin III family protein [bacterium]